MFGRSLPSFPPCVRVVGSFQELISTRFADGVNALCWPRALAGDFAEVVTALRNEDEIAALSEERLRSLALSAAGRVAVEAMLQDFKRLQALGLDPALNCINGYPQDDEPGPVRTDVFSFHADSAPVEADTWLCTYFGSPSEGVANDQARRHVDVPETRVELLKRFGGAEGEAFREFLTENCFDLHYALLPGAQPYSFGVGNLWRIATDWPGSPVPPCIHRAPTTIPGEPRLLLIS